MYGSVAVIYVYMYTCRRDTELSMSLSYPSRGKGHVPQSPQHERGPLCEDTAHRTLPAHDTRI